eukprot:1159547-Pelagomonas_calceolata.AAC.10
MCRRLLTPSGALSCFFHVAWRGRDTPAGFIRDDFLSSEHCLAVQPCSNQPASGRKSNGSFTWHEENFEAIRRKEVQTEVWARMQGIKASSSETAVFNCACEHLY